MSKFDGKSFSIKTDNNNIITWHKIEEAGMRAKSEKEAVVLRGLQQWTTSDNKRFIPASNTSDLLVPGMYEIQHSQNVGYYFEKIPVLTTDLVRFPQTNIEKVVEEIQKFWDREERFREYNLAYRRGILMFGPPGSGKSCCIKLLLKDVVNRGGVCVKFTNPVLFSEGMRIFREIQPHTPVVILMEDLDSILETYTESEVLNILDGVNQIDKAVFLATTNYPEALGPRIINRPSRFDKRFEIGHPNSQSREIYFRHIIGDKNLKKLKIDLNRWVEDTEDFSIAHLQELFVAVVIQGDEYEEAISSLRKMKEETISSKQYESTKPMGFGI